MNSLYWREPLWLGAAFWPLLPWLWGYWRRRRVQRAYADAALWPWLEVPRTPRAARMRPLFFFLAWVCLCAAAAGPRLALEIPPRARPPQGAVAAVVDLSRSMEARDMSGSRRDAAVRLLMRWNKSADARPLGLVLFAGRAHVMFPPGTDSGARGHFLRQLPGVRMPTLGNAVAEALQKAAALLPREQEPRILALFSDGDWGDSALREALPAARALGGQGIILKVFGLGGGAAAAIPDEAGAWLSENGRPLVTRRGDAALRQLAAAGGGAYYRASEETLAEALGRAAAPRIAPEQRDSVVWRELYPWFLLPGLLLLAFVLLRPPAAAPFFLLGLLFTALPRPAAADSAGAYTALRTGRYTEALAAYREMPGYLGRYGEGTACFHLEELPCAARAFAAAAWLAENDAQRARAAYNLAGVLYRQGDYEQAALLYRDAKAHALEQPKLDEYIEYAELIAAQVKERLRQEQERRARRGGGTRAAPPEAADNEALSRTFDDKSEKRPPPLPKGMDAALFAQLLARGLEHARAAAAGQSPARESTWFGGEDAAAERAGSALWERLFEIEEGFPAPPEKARPRPGERAW